MKYPKATPAQDRAPYGFVLVTAYPSMYNRHSSLVKIEKDIMPLIIQADKELQETHEKYRNNHHKNDRELPKIDWMDENGSSGPSIV